MLDFYAQINSPNPGSDLYAALARLTRLSRAQIRIFSADYVWNTWGL